jgi:FKBP-type peptidyl-prolyl cis-trans isomerase
VPTTNQRREAAQRRLQKQLEDRRAQEAARKRTTLIASIVATVVVIAGVVVGVVLSTGGDSAKPQGNKPGAQPTASDTVLAPPQACSPPPQGKTAAFDGVTVTGATDLKHAPTVKSLSEQAPNSLECMDLVVGKGAPAAPGATVTVQYTGVLYKDGTAFDSSWSHGQPAKFTLKTGPGGVIDGFNQGIGGTGNVAPMRIGGRRLMILPASLAYGSQSNGSVPANAPLVFVVDLLKVSK